MKRLALIPTAQEDGLDLVEFLARAGGLDAAQASAIANAGGIFLGGRRLERLPAAVRAGQPVLVRFEAASTSQSALQPQPQILFEDRELLVLNKPPGMATQATASGWSGTLTAWAARHLGRSSPDEVGLVHRLDRDTSGILLIGKTNGMTAGLALAFREGRVHKRYLAVAAGPVEGEGMVERALRKDPNHRSRQAVAPHGAGAPATTRYQALSPAGAATVVACWPLTGKTHQIRVHLAWLGAPLLGDRLYGGSDQVIVAGHTVVARRPLLHAESIQFEHPRTQSPLEFAAPPAPDIATAIGVLMGAPRAR